MAAEYEIEGGATPPQAGGEPRRGRRGWILWLAIFGGILAIMLLKERVEPGEVISQHRFEELVDAGQIAHANICYDPRNPALNEIVGTYYREQNGEKTQAPFRTKVRLTGGLERRLLSLPQFEPHHSNPWLMSIVWSVLPIILIAALIWFFFIRQIRMAARTTPTASRVSEFQARTAGQQDRLDKLLDKWEEQSRRLDAVLDKMER